MNTPNPWSVVPASDYEAHMGIKGVDQLGPLSQLFQEVYAATQPDRLLVLGCATGNGLEHVDPNVSKRIVGVDVNLQYLGIARQRYFHLGPRLELYNQEVEKFRAAPGSFDLVHAALIFEYLYPEVLVRKIAEWLAEKGTCSVVLQLPGGEGPEPPSKAMQIIKKAMKLVNPEELTSVFEQYKLPRKRSKVVSLRGGKSFWMGLFGK
ncbi:MAG TPA: class I SAM-dependent methyltransferase [Anaeromyxobacteraceae bacterium]|nr:class I SAM-dependent methyltransferase [Anaeromyxobacteraceae bacterium]